MTGLREDEREAVDAVRHSLGNIGHLNAAQRDLMALGVDWAAAADVLGKVQREYVCLVNEGLDGIEALLAARAVQTDAATAEGPTCTDPDCPIYARHRAKRQTFPPHGPHDFRAALTSEPQPPGDTC